MSRNTETEPLYLDIDASGRPSVDQDTASWLTGEGVGRWRIVPELGRLMVLERLEDGDAASGTAARVDREVHLSGVFDSGSRVATMFNLIHLEKLDGALVIVTESCRKVLYFRRGVYLSGHSDDPRHRLGEVLVRAGILSAAQQRSIGNDADEGVRLGRLLVTKGWMTTPQVYEGLRMQAEEIFFSTLCSSRGTFHLLAPLDMTRVPAMMRLDIEHLLLEGMRRIDEAAAAVPEPIEDDELRRTRPVSVEDLPDDGAVRIISAYNDALEALFEAVHHDARAELLTELERYVADSVPYRDLFRGVDVTDRGTLRAERLFDNMVSVGPRRALTLLQVGLNELLFFVMFAAGDALPPEVEQVLQRDVARALQKLPQARA